MKLLFTGTAWEDEMEMVIPVFAIFVLALAGMAVGVLAGRQPIKGSCGGLGCIGKLNCEDCPHRHKDQPE